MLAKLWFLGSVSLLLVACSQIGPPVITPMSVAEEQQNPSSVQITATAEIHMNLPEDTKPAITPTETEGMLEPPQKSTCDDPFEGEQVDFAVEYWETNFCLHSVPYQEIASGGPPPDGIPALDDPKFESVIDADTWLEDCEPVIFFREAEDVRAYPLQILTWHEIVNDVVGDKPVVVTFCPLCNTALVFERPPFDGEILTFGTSGNLRNSDLVMYDRQTETWWQQFSGEAIVGDLTGTQLSFLPASIISWGDFKTQYPDGQVLSHETGFNRRYGSNPYAGYDDIDQSPFLYNGPLEDQLLPLERVLGVILSDGASIAYPFTRLREEQVINETLGDNPIVAFWKAGTASALDTSEIVGGQDIGSTGVFLRTVDDQVLTFIGNGDGTYEDEQTGSTWNLAGLALNGPLQGSQLTALPHHDTFWFAWAAFVSPETLDQD